jgi:serine protease
VTVVVAAGNDEGLAVGAPANCTGALAVAGLRHIGTKVGFSSIGTAVAISAPGGNCVNITGACLYPILTTTNAGTTTPTTSTYSDSFNASVGTSFSTPMVAGTVALMLSVKPNLTPADVLQAIRSTARRFPSTGAAPTNGVAVKACVAPTSVAQDECYCTTSTCGAGMLDAAAAVAAAATVVTPPVVVSPPQATVTVSTSTPTVGTSVTLSGTRSSAGTGRILGSYQWQITSGATLAAFSGSTTGSTATLVTSAAGAVTVSLTVTDSGGATATTSTTINVQAAPATPTSSGSNTAGSSGGGAMSALWLALLALATAALAWARCTPHPGPTALKAAARRA